MAQRAAVEYGRGFWSGVQTSRSTGTSLWMVLTRAPLLKGVVSLHKAERSKPHTLVAMERPTLEVVLQALQTMYKDPNTSHDKRDQVNKWLSQLQSSVSSASAGFSSNQCPPCVHVTPP